MRQAIAIVRIYIATIPQRLGACSIIVIGIGGVTGVLVSLLAMAQGFESTVRATGQDDRVLILRSGSTSEVNGNIPIDQYGVISVAPQIRQSGGRALASMETYVTVRMPQRDGGGDGGISMRGINDRSLPVRAEVNIVTGRHIEFGKYELLAGVAAQQQFVGLDVGAVVRIRGVDWRVVGAFRADKGIVQSEIWVDERLLAQAWKRGKTFSSMLVQLNSAADFAAFKHRVESDRRLTVQAWRESEYYATQSAATTQLITGVALLVSFVMGLGAALAAANAMHAAVAERKAETATLRALGFGSPSIFAALLGEAILLSAIGALLGGGLSFLLLDGLNVATVAATTASFVVVGFNIAVTPMLVALGMLVACVLGLLGATLPAWQAIRGPIITNLQPR